MLGQGDGHGDAASQQITKELAHTLGAWVASAAPEEAIMKARLMQVPTTRERDLKELVVRRRAADTRVPDALIMPLTRTDAGSLLASGEVLEFVV